MKRITLKEDLMPYPESYLNNWVEGDYSMITSSKAPQYIEDIIIKKAKARPGTRFFGEAYVATTYGKTTKNGWYNSFKWLYADKWYKGEGLEPQFEEPFFDALVKYVGWTKLHTLQRHARDYVETVGLNPQAPDLWLIDKAGKSCFIEVKKGSDRIHEGQLEGLALIKKYLNAKVSIVSLYPEGGRVPKRIDHTDRFTEIYNSIID
ncbi:hypothetical protein ACFL4N_01395 [Thermodesulfobacteriota bacterium]